RSAAAFRNAFALRDVDQDVGDEPLTYPAVVQPARAARRRYSFASGTFVTRMFAPSYSILRPARNATTPRSITSVSFAAYSNGHEAVVLPFAASAQFISCPSFGIRGSFCAGLPNESCSDFGSSRGLAP